jgi:hypothetical protein
MIDIFCAVCGTLMDIENVDHRYDLEIKVKCSKCEDNYAEKLEDKDTVISEQANWLATSEEELDEAVARVDELETFIDEYIESE